MADTGHVWAYSKTTGVKQLIPAHWIELRDQGIEPFTDFNLTPTQKAKTAISETTTKESK